MLASPVMGQASTDQSPAPRQGQGQSEGSSTERTQKEADEYKVKANLLHSFLKYAKFPEGTFAHAKSPIVVLVIGDDPFGPLLKTTFAKKKVGGRTIQIRRLKRIPNRICAHLVFAHGLEAKERKRLIAKLCTRPCLLVADVPGFAAAGGFINLYMHQGKVRFEINECCLKTTGVMLKAELLKLARMVTAESVPEEKKS